MICRNLLRASTRSNIPLPTAILSRLASTTVTAPPLPLSPPSPPSSSRPLPTPTKRQKKILITGGSRGIGAAIAQKFALEGATCILVGRSRSTLVDVASSLYQEPNDERHWSHIHGVRVGDVGSREFWEELRRDEKLKDVDVLVNAAGTTHYSLLTNTKAEQLEQVVQTNLMGTIWSCKYMVKNMMRRKTGCIINVASLLGLKGGTGSTVYAASKAGIIGLTRSLAAEVGPLGIRVNTLLPGYIETQMTDAMIPEARSNALEAIPMKRFGTTKEVADAAYFLAINEYANNCVLNLDGGLSAT